jgi:LCP family protein required for cell wall assembly
MGHHRDFWSQDRTTIHQKSGWFSKLPPLQKTSYTLLLLFIISWCFYLGMSYSFAIAPEIELDYKDGSEWKDEMKEATGAEVMRLTGVEVALLVGADKRPQETRYRTDTIILVFYNWDKDELKILSIPRDSYVQFPGRPTKTKINEAYFYGGMALLESVIEYTFGIEVDHYVEIDFAGFLHLIDALGGVEIDVPQHMYKPTEEINIKKGLQTLYGYDALGFVRFRDLPMGDIDRIDNQQMFIRALTAKIANSSIWKAPELVRIVRQHTNSNYDLPEALLLGTALFKTDLNNIPMYSLPGNGLYIGAANYWILNKKGVIDIITEITGGAVGDFHIISDEGKGSSKPPIPPKEEIEEDIPEEGDNSDDEETLPPENEKPGEGQNLNPEDEQEPENPEEQQIVIPLPEQLEEQPLPEPTDDRWVG